MEFSLVFFLWLIVLALFCIERALDRISIAIDRHHHREVDKAPEGDK